MSSKEEMEVVEVSDDDDEEEDPGRDATRPIEPSLLLPFFHGWKRECVFRAGSNECDIYYIPSCRSNSKTRGSDIFRKRRSKKDMERYFERYPHPRLSSTNFNYALRPLGLNNENYEIIRSARDSPKEALSPELEESDDDEIMEEFSMEIPIVLQATRSIIGMKAEYKKRRKIGKRCRTPFLAEESPWTNLEDDPMGIFTALGGSSDPPTPPPLRAVKLTPKETAEKIITALKEVHIEAAKTNLLEEQKMKEHLSSHDAAIRKYKNCGDYSIHRVKKIPLTGGSNGKSHLPCTLHCPEANGLLPNLTCASCQCLFHASCQGVSSLNPNEFKCRACDNAQSRIRSAVSLSTNRNNYVVKVKLPMPTTNRRRPIVELVMQQNGKYQPIKFSNNMQVTESISRTIFERATALKRTLYQRATQVPRVGGRPIFLAINPSTSNNREQLSALLSTATKYSHSRRPPFLSSNQVDNNEEQVSILVRPQSSAKPVLLNVPRKIAFKVKVGTTLSFSASSDQKYTVIDNKIHPPVNSSKNSRRPSTIVSAPTPDLSSYEGISVSRVVKQNQTPYTSPKPLSFREESREKTLTELEMTPCTPYCPGVSGFPEVECNGCRSLFHSKCVGLTENYRLNSGFRCKICSKSRNCKQIPTNPPQVIDLE